jgi:flagellar hook-associated protein 2
VFNITARDGTAFSVTIDKGASLSDIFAQISTASGTGANGKPRISVGLDNRGTGIALTDNTGGSQNLVITGTSGQDTAASLGLATAPAGVAASTMSSGNLQHQYVSLATPVSSLNNGKGIGTGTFRITDSLGNTQTVNIDSDTQTVGDLLDEINSRGLKVTARVNDHGDGIEIDENMATGPAGSVAIKVDDIDGTVAKSLNLAGQASGIGAANTINGTFEKTVTFTAADSLQTIANKINAAKVGVNASIINDGSGTAPYRLNLSSASTGEAGRFIVDTGAVNLGLQTLDPGNDSRVFFGSTDPAKALAVTSSTNTVDTVVPGVKIDLTSASSSPVTLNISTDSSGIETSVNTFIDAFNSVVDYLTQQTSYDQTSDKAGPLLGDSTTLNVRSVLYNTLGGTGIGLSGQFGTLADIGINVGDGGKLSLNDDRFRQAMADDPDGVEALFDAHVQANDSVITLQNGITVSNPNPGHTFTSLGVMGQFEEMATHFIDSVDGVLTTRNKSLDDEIDQQNSRITDINTQLDNKRQLLQEQFTAMEEAIGKMQSQQSSLSAIHG